MRIRHRSTVRGLLILLPVLALAPFGTRPALAQGQESSTSTMAAHTSGHPAPLLSTADVTSVPSAQTTPGLSSVPLPVPKDKAEGLALPGSVVLASPSRLDCNEIRAANARARCEQRKTPPAPPAGAPS